MPYTSVFHALEIFLRNRRLGALVLPVNGHDPPTTTIVEQLNAVDPAHEWFGIVGFVARLVRAPDMRNIAELLGATRNFLFVKPFFLKQGFCARDESINIQDLWRKSAIRMDSSRGKIGISDSSILRCRN